MNMAISMESSLGEDFVTQALAFGTDRISTSTTLNRLKKYTESIQKVRQAQLRRYYREIKNADLNSVVMIRPLLAYGIGRAGVVESDSKALKGLLSDLETIIASIDTDDKLKNFKLFMESLLAYHKMYAKN